MGHASGLKTALRFPALADGKNTGEACPPLNNSTDLNCGGIIMDNGLLNRLMWIAITGLFLAGAIFIGLFLFSEDKDSTLLFSALFCDVLAGLFNLVRGFQKK